MPDHTPPLLPGRYKVTVRDNTMREINDKAVVSMMCTHESAAEPFEVLIWLSDASFGIARQQLNICGFNVDEENVASLYDNTERLSGKEIPVIVVDKGDKTYINVDMNQPPSRKAMAEITQGLRDAKKSALPF